MSLAEANMVSAPAPARESMSSSPPLFREFSKAGFPKPLNLALEDCIADSTGKEASPDPMPRHLSAKGPSVPPLL
eukprot:CAMPEP_0184099442 /NCGR_PEP_ID=MMETSP0974-20121125/11825_1 /TAXON_ID=483370 /ORGANISM="non described non described, Strain CCMP2097" /LENGTH=74 /DNA_ID=CAMNT_0026402351 /DNA_START=132 /DNA_END=356 /DNA_ORIENTATION=+